MPKHSHGTINLDHFTSSSKILRDSFIKLFDKISNPLLLIRKLNLSVNKLTNETKIKPLFEQIDLFTNYKELQKKKQLKIIQEQNDKKIIKVMLKLKDKYGKNSILRGMDMLEGATTIERNKQIGGHHE